MKKTTITTAVLAVLTFVACKKDNLQPASDNSSLTENKKVDDNKDIRNYYVGKWRRSPEMLIISKSGLKDLKVEYKNGSTTNTNIYKNKYGKYVYFSNEPFTFPGKTQPTPCFVKRELKETTETKCYGTYPYTYITETVLSLRTTCTATDGSGLSYYQLKEFFPYY